MRACLAAILLLPVAAVQPALAQAAGETIDFFATNTVTVELGREGRDDGLKHLDRVNDGRTTIEDLNGIPCRYLNRMPEGRTHGYLYFAIHPDFKERPLKAARIEVEYFVTNGCFLRLQYDAIDGDITKPYKGLPAHGGTTVKNGTSSGMTRVQGSNAWQKATFYVADGAFKNSQSGRADFRLEVIPPEIYVRRVTVTREDAQSSPRSRGHEQAP